MRKDLVTKIRQLPKLRLLIIIFTLWQYVSVAGMAVLNWPAALVWLNLGLLAAFILICPVYESLLLLILSVPFSVVVPNARFESLPMWRILYLGLVVVWLVRDKRLRFREIQFLPWDKYLAWFLALGLILVAVVGRFKAEGFKQGLFLANIYFLYLVLVNTVKSRRQVLEIIRYAIWSIVIIVTLGFTQLIGTFVTDLDTFWVYWASNVTKLYYGPGLAAVSLYSNSWFSYIGGRELRMFSIMPDSQSFAYVCLIGLCMGTALTRNVFHYVRKWLWSGIRFAGLALILSGTRAVWVGMAAPFAAAAFAYVKNFHRNLAKKFLIPFAIIFVLFLISPFINKGLAYLKVGKFQENFLSRAQSIYDLKESSNRGRLEMWKTSMLFAVTHPWGVGFGNFLVSTGPVPAGGSYEEAASRINEHYNLPARFVSAHSLYLQILVETGVAGFLVFAGFWICVVKYLWGFIQKHDGRHDFLVYFVVQALLMVLWVLAAAAFDITIFNDKVLMYFLLNLGIAGVIVKNYSELEEHE